MNFIGPIRNYNLNSKDNFKSYVTKLLNYLFRNRPDSLTIITILNYLYIDKIVIV